MEDDSGCVSLGLNRISILFWKHMTVLITENWLVGLFVLRNLGGGEPGETKS